MKNLYLNRVFLLLSLSLITLLSAKAQYKLFNQDYDKTRQFNLSKSDVKEYRQEGKLIIFNEEKHRTSLAVSLLDKKVGKDITQESVTQLRTYEVISSTKVKHHRLRYIFIDGNKLTKKQVRKRIDYIKRLLDDKASFESTAHQYSMDRNSRRGGDSGWFKKAETHPVFYDAVAHDNRYANEVFEVSIPENNWYYLVKKTFSPKPIREVLILKKVEKRK